MEEFAFEISQWFASTFVSKRILLKTFFADAPLADTGLNDKNENFSNTDNDLAFDMALDLFDDSIAEIMEEVEDAAENEDLKADQICQEILGLVNNDDDEKGAVDSDSEAGKCIIDILFF